MKPLTSDTLAKAAIIEGYCWEIAALEVANKNTTGAQYFMGVADSLHRMYECGHDGEEPPEAVRIPRFPHLSDSAPGEPPSMLGGVGGTTRRSA